MFTTLEHESAPTEAGALSTHKEDKKPSLNRDMVPDWRRSVTAWYAGGQRPGPYAMRLAMESGLPPHLPQTPKQRVRALALADFDYELIFEAVPEATVRQVIQWIELIPKVVFQIIERHKMGMSPVEIAGDLQVSRSRIYYWLGQAGLEPHRVNRPELTKRQRDHIIRAFESGEPMASIARRTGFSYDQVRYAVTGS